jgi:hypothetical protein
MTRNSILMRCLYFWGGINLALNRLQSIGGRGAVRCAVGQC